MKKFAILLIIMSILTVALTVTVAINFGTKIKNANIKANENIGNRIVINKDTLMIVDYSLINETYTLETGVKVNFNLVNKKNIISK